MKKYQKGDGVVGNNDWLTKATHVYHIPCCEQDTWGAEIYPYVFALAKPQDAIVIKGGYSAFWETTAFLDVLREKQITEAYFCRVSSGTCVLASIVDALKIGEVNVNVVPDCMGWRRYNTDEEATRRFEEMKVGIVNSCEFKCGKSILEKGN